MATKKLPHIMLGKAKVVPLKRAGTGMDYFERVMARLRLQAPMPVPIDKLLCWLLPQSFLQLDTAVAQRKLTGPEENALSLMHVNRDPTVRHVRMSSARDDVFWFRAQVLHSVWKIDSETVDMICPPGEAHDTLAEWMHQARGIEDAIEGATAVIDMLCKANLNPRAAYGHWPQLQSILKLPISGAGKYVAESHAERIMASVPRFQREQIAGMFANGLMLPDQRTDAWVGRHYGYGEE